MSQTPQHYKNHSLSIGSLFNKVVKSLRRHLKKAGKIKNWLRKTTRRTAAVKKKKSEGKIVCRPNPRLCST